jgi:sterol desaturase/sphingolipid hydroxylase (fatty acid hydroxylase superfamily)
MAVPSGYSEASIRLGIFLAVFLFLAGVEVFLPRRRLQYSKTARWLSNISLTLVNTVIARLVVPVAGVAAALTAEQQQWGLLNYATLPNWFELVLFLLAFDLAIYFQHRVFHAVPFLWRLHRMHHTDRDYDVTTGNRFHPLSIVISNLIKTALILLTGPSALAVIVAEILLNACSMFNHSNLRIPLIVDRFLRLIMVTPDMHRVHHSTDHHEHNCNFGFNFPWWDRLFGTYLAQPALGHDNMEIGIEGFRDSRSEKLLPLLKQPLQP